MRLLPLLPLGVLALLAGGAVAAASATAAPAGALAQVRARTPGGGGAAPYDGRFQFVRVRWGDGGGSGAAGEACMGRREPLWAHDMCARGEAAENYFALILSETTLIDPHLKGRVHTLDDPDLFRYPVAYIVEVGNWRPSEAEADGLRNFLLKGGFLIVDDFRGPEELRNFQTQMGRVLPGVQLLPVEAGHRVWDSFFFIRDPGALAPPTYPQHVPAYLGIFEDDDPTGRLMAIINLNQDIGDYWEWSPDGFLPIPLTNEAYKFGVNYIVYAMTH